MAHTHACPRCGTITAHHCTGRNAGAPDCPPCCEYDLDAGPYGNLCEDCYGFAMDEMDAEARAEAKALLPFRVGHVN